MLQAAVARRYYIDGHSKIEIADDLGISRFKVARAIERARDSGLVRIELHYDGEIDLELSLALSARLGLKRCLVLSASEGDDVALRANLGRITAGLLEEIVEAGDVLGLSWSRTLLSMRPHMHGMAPCDIVQLTGALSRPDVDESSVELVRDVARVTGGAAYYFYAPMIVPKAEVAASLRMQPEVAQAMAKFDALTKVVVTIGAWRLGQSTVADAVTAEEYRASLDAGVVCEMGGLQLASDGSAVKTPLRDKTIGIEYERLRRVPEIVAIAYGPEKVTAVRAAINAGLATTLVTHTALAQALLAAD